MDRTKTGWIDGAAHAAGALDALFSGLGVWSLPMNGCARPRVRGSWSGAGRVVAGAPFTWGEMNRDPLRFGPSMNGRGGPCLCCRGATSDRPNRPGAGGCADAGGCGRSGGGSGFLWPLAARLQATQHKRAAKRRPAKVEFFTLVRG